MREPGHHIGGASGTIESDNVTALVLFARLTTPPERRLKSGMDLTGYDPKP